MTTQTQAATQIDFNKVGPFVLAVTKVMGVRRALTLHRALAKGHPSSRQLLRDALRVMNAAGATS